MERQEDALHQHPAADGKLLTHSHEGGALPHTHSEDDEAPNFNWYAIGHMDGMAANDCNPPNNEPDDFDHLAYEDGYSDGKEDREGQVPQPAWD